MHKIKIDTDKKITDISKSLYGIFFEDINRSGDGGLYAEMLANRAFDDGVIPDRCTYSPESKTITSPTGWVCSFNCFEGEGIYGWRADSAEMSLTDKCTLNSARKRALNVRFNGGKIYNRGFEGLAVREGSEYRFYMFAKTETAAEVEARLVSSDGVCISDSHTFIVKGGYTKYECIFKANKTDFNAALELYSDSCETVTIGFTSLFPIDTFCGRENGLRKDLATMLVGLKPSFLRFPGGCIVEGFTRETAYRFEDSIGPVWERRPHRLLWGYNSTNGLGFHEFMQFCEDAGIDAMYVFNCGMTCQARCPDYFDDGLVEEFYQDARHAILYATAPADSEWGSQRAANGHTEPFKCLKYLEIGNENYGEEYENRYKLFYDRLKAEFPQFKYIATDHVEKSGLSADLIDDHYYADPLFFASNHDTYNGHTDADIYVGEYASTIGCKQGTLMGALGEAAFLTGIERDQDKVKMTSYAPLLNNPRFTEWQPDLITFNNHQCYGIPGYYMLKMFAENRGNYVCGCDVETGYFSRHDKGSTCLLTDGDKKAIDSTETNTGVVYSYDFDKPVSELHLTFFDNGLTNEDQNRYELTAADGRCTVTHYNGWSKMIVSESEYTGELEVKSFTFSIDGNSYELCINGDLLHSVIIKQVPDITAVCTVDTAKNELIIKLVNLTESDIEVSLESDRALSREFCVQTLTANSKDDGNSFDEPEKVIPRRRCFSVDDSIVHVSASSVNVFRAGIG